jgi:hypothetical protein
MSCAHLDFETRSSSIRGRYKSNQSVPIFYLKSCSHCQYDTTRMTFDPRFFLHPAIEKGGNPMPLSLYFLSCAASVPSSFPSFSFRDGSGSSSSSSSSSISSGSSGSSSSSSLGYLAPRRKKEGSKLGEGGEQARAAANYLNRSLDLTVLPAARCNKTADTNVKNRQFALKYKKSRLSKFQYRSPVLSNFPCANDND